MEVRVSWHEGMRFVGVGPSNHAVVLDTDAVGGEGTGPRPMELVLMALGGCTAMDVVSILNKMRTPPQALEVLVRAERATEHPRAVRRVHLTYRARGVPLENLERAAQLSQERYCSVAHSLKAEVSFSIEALE
ncbi:OsmC family protein [Candidatus Bipolaricaulota sp. J31]